jgi:hypothetical protein
MQQKVIDKEAIKQIKKKQKEGKTRQTNMKKIYNIN